MTSRTPGRASASFSIASYSCSRLESECCSAFCSGILLSFTSVVQFLESTAAYDRIVVPCQHVFAVRFVFSLEAARRSQHMVCNRVWTIGDTFRSAWKHHSNTLPFAASPKPRNHNFTCVCMMANHSTPLCSGSRFATWASQRARPMPTKCLDDKDGIPKRQRRRFPAGLSSFLKGPHEITRVCQRSWTGTLSTGLRARN